jgi:DeoR/GlpR family transcriptional regulator of sugar metabolism
VDGVSLVNGCTVPSTLEAEVIKQMIERTRGKVFIVADSSKWGVVANYQVATINGLDKLITDESFDLAAIEDLTAASVECLIASERTIRI